MASASPAARRRRAVESFRSAADCIGPVEPGLSVFAVTRGQFSMLDAILHCLDQIGPAAVSVWTWAIADYEVEAMEGLMARREITDGLLIIDWSADRRNALTVDRWRARFGPDRVRVVKNHAKIARVWNERFRILLRGSMNLNFNPRFEQFDVTEGGQDFDLVGASSRSFRFFRATVLTRKSRPRASSANRSTHPLSPRSAA